MNALDRVRRRFGGSPEARAHRSALRFYRQFMRRGDLCFDVGANVGARTRVFRDLGAEVVAIEPQRACVERLREEFGADEGVEIVAKAVGSEPGSAEIAICDDDPGLSTLSARWRQEGRFAGTHHWSTAERVEMTTMDELIARHGRPLFCKVDVEGFEREVFRGLSSRLPCISFEYAREFIEEAEACVALLAEAGPVEVAFSYGESMRWLCEWTRPELVFESLRRLEQPDAWGDLYVRPAAAA